MMKRVALLALLAACGDDGSSSGVDASSSGVLTLTTCTTTVGTGVPEPYASRFKCVDMSVSGTDLVIKTTGLPPHMSYYYGSSSPNFVAWDDRGGTYHANPNTLQKKNVTLTIPLTPVSRNLAITSGMVDGTVMTSSSEYKMGPAGVAFDSVIVFNPLAAPGDDIAQEQYTFDPYNAHPAPDGAYHYHRDSPGPVEAGTDGVGVMCDGTWILGCSELDGSAADETDLDAQNGHQHGIVYLGDRYHVHICPTFTTHTRIYTPEIQFYDRCSVQ
jgi:hypothetical protein